MLPLKNDRNREMRIVHLKLVLATGRSYEEVLGAHEIFNSNFMVSILCINFHQPLIMLIKRSELYNLNIQIIIFQYSIKNFSL